MKTYKEFLEEKVNPATRALRNREFNQNLKDKKKKEAAAKGGALVHQPGKGRTEKEAVGKRTDPRATQNRPPGVSGFKQSTTARTNSQGRQNALALYRKKNKMNPLRKELQKAAGWETGKDTKGSYAARHGVALTKKAAGAALNKAGELWRNARANNSVTVDQGTPIA